MITLATLPHATAQEVFDQVKSHLLKQGKRAVRKFGCVFRTKSGLACAAGCLMTNAEAARLEKANGWWDEMAAEGSVPIQHNQLIRSLQRVHDEDPPRDWLYRLDMVADIYGLKR